MSSVEVPGVYWFCWKVSDLATLIVYMPATRQNSYQITSKLDLTCFCFFEWTPQTWSSAHHQSRLETFSSTCCVPKVLCVSCPSLITSSLKEYSVFLHRCLPRLIFSDLLLWVAWRLTERKRGPTLYALPPSPPPRIRPSIIHHPSMSRALYPSTLCFCVSPSDIKCALTFLQHSWSTVDHAYNVSCVCLMGCAHKHTRVLYSQAFIVPPLALGRVHVIPSLPC